MLLSLEEVKKYLRVDSKDEDDYIQNLMYTADTMCRDIARIDNDLWISFSYLGKTAVLYTIGYLYEHREEADYKDLMDTIKNLLFQIRREVF